MLQPTNPSIQKYDKNFLTMLHLVVIVRISLYISARTFQEVQKDVANLTDGKILVGHAIHNDLKVNFTVSIHSCLIGFGSEITQYF